jgi:hypothetical protein
VPLLLLLLLLHVRICSTRRVTIICTSAGIICSCCY